MSFRRNWLRDQNQTRIQSSRRVSQQDANRIRAAVADSFKLIFTEELEKAGYTVVDPTAAENGPNDLLLLHPDILDLDVTAPDIASPGRTRTYTACGCSMTLSLELFDAMSGSLDFRDKLARFMGAMSGSLLARITDRKKAPDQRPMRITNSVTNKADADRIMRRWAKMLVDKLASVHGT